MSKIDTIISYFIKFVIYIAKYLKLHYNVIKCLIYLNWNHSNELIWRIVVDSSCLTHYVSRRKIERIWVSIWNNSLIYWLLLYCLPKFTNLISLNCIILVVNLHLQMLSTINRNKIFHILCWVLNNHVSFLINVNIFVKNINSLKINIS